MSLVQEKHAPQHSTIAFEYCHFHGVGGILYPFLSHPPPPDPHCPCSHSLMGLSKRENKCVVVVSFSLCCWLWKPVLSRLVYRRVFRCMEMHECLWKLCKYVVFLVFFNGRSRSVWGLNPSGPSSVEISSCRRPSCRSASWWVRYASNHPFGLFLVEDWSSVERYKLFCTVSWWVVVILRYNTFSSKYISPWGDPYEVDGMLKSKN